MAGGTGGKRQDHPIPPTPPSTRHCWVADADGRLAVHPGLVMAWRDAEDGKRLLLVTYFVEGDKVLVQQWLDAELVQRVL
ncbi:hypothetical protein GCM10027053_51850 [Intrasporangium mesophilum]